MGFKQSEFEHNLNEGARKLLVSSNFSDCTFKVSGREFKAHKLIMAMGSPVFEAMFYGPLSSNTSAIVVEDIEPDTFQLLLNYVYTDNVKICSIEQAFELLYASRKYLLDNLGRMCIAFMQDLMTVDNVVTILNYPDYIQDNKFKLEAVKFFCEHAQYLFQKNKHLISPLCLMSILKSGHINITEKDLIINVFEWAFINCHKNNLSSTIESRREFLINSGLFKFLRFLTLSLDDLNEIISNEFNLLTPNEYENVKKIILNSSNFNTTNLSFDLTLLPRSNIKLQWQLCYRSTFRSVAPTTIGLNNNTINCRIKTNKSVFLHSLCVPTRLSRLAYQIDSPNTYVEYFSVSIVCESENSLSNVTKFKQKVEYNSTMDIELSELCLISKNEWYRITFIWPPNGYGQPSHYSGTHKDSSYEDHRITVKFDDMSVYPNGAFLDGLKFCF